jgi:hypothetical protein
MGLEDAPWQVRPARAKRVADDFDVSRDREQLLEDIATRYQPNGFNAVFYYDSKTGYAHGYAPLSWTVVYTEDGSDFIAVPIREAETRSTLNDPEHPNCIGAYRDETLATCSSLNPDDPPWGCAADGCAGGESPATTRGYFLISELEQIYSTDLHLSLCVSYPTQPEVAAQGFWNPDDQSCRSAKWDATKADGSGLPEGDWCAATNSAKNGTCHDAWLSESFHVYAGAKIQVDETCSF